MASFSICRRFPQFSIPASRVIPVRLPPGRRRLVRSPACNGSSMNATTGIVLVAALKAITTGLVPVTITSGLRLTILASQIGITLVVPFGGIALDDQIFAFDVTQAA